MPNPATLRERRLRMTKAQLIDEIDTLEQRAAAIEAAHGSGAPIRAKASERYLADQELAHLARFASENPNPVLRVMPDGTVLYANDAAIAVRRLLEGRKKSTLASDLAGVCAEASHAAEVRETEFESDDRVFAFSIAPIADETYINIYGRDITERKRAEQELAERDAQLRVALDYMPGGIRFVDEDRNYVFFNARYLELYDFPEGLLKVGEPYRVENLYQAERGDFGPGDPEALTDEWIVSLTRETESQSWERTTVTGKVLQVSTAPTPVGGFVNIVTDITERKRAEEALLEAKRRAEEAGELVAEKNRMLESVSNQLSKYLSPQVCASIFSGEQAVEIASKRKKLTVFFSDIADFTGTTDSLEPEDLTNLLNHYLTEMSKIALDYGATIDKYVGDAVIAFFGDPESRGVEEDARACVNMALAMQRRMRELQSEWLDMGLERPFQLRIGINTGFCTVGNFGSAERMDYTIIGNEVNLASRLESHAEVGGILMAHETHSLVKDTVMAEERSTLTVKGFAKPVRTYGVVGRYDDLTEQGRIIHEERDGVRVLVDLKRGDKADAIRIIKDVLCQLED